MDYLSHRVKKEEIKPGDHIYTWRALFTYSHHGIYVGGSKVVHFTCDDSNLSSSSASFGSKTGIPYCCPTFPDCGVKQPNNGMILSCLECFIGNGSLHLYTYGVNKLTLVVKRAGTCTIAQSDLADKVIQRAMLRLHIGFGKYCAVTNNCEDFALYCKTGRSGIPGVGRSNQTSSFRARIAAVGCIPLTFFMPTAGVVTVAAMVYSGTRYKDVTSDST